MDDTILGANVAPAEGAWGMAGEILGRAGVVLGVAGAAERLYYSSTALEFEAKVRDIRLVSTVRPGGAIPATPGAQGGAVAQLWQVALDRTAFYPEGGGQPWDTGVLVATSRSGATLEVPVERVEEDEAGEVWHFVRKPLVEGTEVEGHVDAVRRLDHEQQHSGQHLLSAMFWREIGAGTVSFHLGAESSTIDLDVAARPGEEQLRRVQEAVNRVIYEQRPMLPHWVEREFAEEMLRRGDLRKLPVREGRMRIMQMQGIEFNACGGTHVRNTGEIGSLLIRRVEKVKQGWRVEFVCGGRGVRTAGQDNALLTQLAGALSTGRSEIPARLAALLEENRASEKVRQILLEELAESQAAELVGRAEDGRVVQGVFAGKDVEFAKRVAAAVARRERITAVGAVDRGAGAVAVARPSSVPLTSLHCGDVLREVFGAAGARGGGAADRAQGVCRAEQVETLVRALAERLQVG